MAGRSVPDPSNQVPPEGLLARAGFEKGDFLPLYTWNPNATRSTGFTSTTYTTDFDLWNAFVQWNKILPAGVKSHILIQMRVAPGTDESVDVRLYNENDGETVGEVTGITSDRTATISEDYTPTTKDAWIEFRLLFRTNPGTNSSTIYVPFGSIGVKI